MNRLLVATLVLVSASVSLPGGGVHAASSYARSSLPGSATLYQANFKSKGLKGWVSRRGGGWHVNHKGVVTFNELLPGAIFAPFRTGSIQNFAVEAKIKTAGPVESGTVGGYGLVVRDTGQESSGIDGGFFPGLYATSAGETGPGMFFWNNETVGGIVPAIHSGYNTYRLEVHDTDYTLFINGQKSAAFKIAEYRTGTRVGIWSNSEKLQIISFKVTQLQPSTPLPTLPPVKAMDLGQADGPSSLALLLGFYFTPEELAYLKSKSPNPILDGYILEHSTAFGYSGSTLPAAGPVFLNSSVAAFGSAQTAQASLTNYWSAVQKQWSSNTKYAAGSISGLGDNANQLSYDYSSGADTFTLVDVVFWRGLYVVELEERFIQGTVSHDDMINQVTALAKIVDRRIQQAG